ncbi:MAG: hypothetical protein V3V14_03210 [Saprospiraceae bacterium]
MKNLFYSIVAFACLSLASCSSSTNCDGSLSTEFETELQAITNAITTYSTDPTTANCDDLKDAYRAYVNALKGWESCAVAAGSSAQWQESIDQAEESIDNFC